MKEQVQLLKTVFDFLDRLSEEQLQLLLSKKAKIKFEMEKEIINTPATQICLEEVCSKIEEFTTREEAIEYINTLSLLKADLKIIAKNYNIPLGSKETNGQIAEKIIENVVGSKLKFDALLNTDLK
ncbi:MAG: hypothetical protein NC312_12180 [Bacteroides fragilis]|nr:hypothetical protein [Bacteroides fragilis]